VSLSELRNRAWAYRWVRFRGATAAPLSAQVAAALRAEPSRALFELEGIGFARARAARREGGGPCGLLTAGEAADLPEESLILLHSGLGLGLASRLFEPRRHLRRGSPAAAFAAAAARFLDLCRASSRPAYLPVAVEPLGLFTRFFRPWLFAPLAAGLLQEAPEHAAGYWHGAGRAYYFRPADLLPGGLGRSVARCLEEPPEAHRLDALAGLAFAVAMVNFGQLREPWAVAGLLRKVAGMAGMAGEDGEEAVTSGVVGCLLARRHTTPNDPALPAFLAWRPAGPERFRELWERRVSGPGTAALSHLYPVLRATGRLTDFARFQRFSP
jgi:hypothetical protein